MANLLPTQHIRRIAHERVLREGALILALLLAATLIEAAFLAPSVIVARSKEASAAAQVDALKALGANLESSDAARAARESRDLLDAFAPVLDAGSVLESVTALIRAAESGIVVNQLSYDRARAKDGAEAAMSVSGVADDRDALVAFVKQIERESRFTDVELPVSHLARETSLPFSLSFSVVAPDTSQ